MSSRSYTKHTMTLALMTLYDRRVESQDPKSPKALVPGPNGLARQLFWLYIPQ